MAGLFDSIPVRSNGEVDGVRASWWNIIRSKLIAAFGEGGFEETQFNLANAQGAFADVTGLIFDKLIVAGATIEYSLALRDATEGRREFGKMTLAYEAEADVWALSIQTDLVIGNPSGVDFEVVAGTGQIRYKGPNLVGGGETLKLRYKALSTFQLET